MPEQAVAVDGGVANGAALGGDVVKENATPAPTSSKKDAAITTTQTEGDGVAS